MQVKQNNLNASKFLKLDRLSLIRELYRSLINSRRTYAAFKENEVYPLVEKLADRNEILDPMSGYGLLTRYCSKIGITAYCIELNPPQYFLANIVTSFERKCANCHNPDDKTWKDIRPQNITNCGSVR